MTGILAKKIGMTRVICPDTGKFTAVTVLEVPGSQVMQVKTVGTDGYDSVVLGSFERKNYGKNTNKKYKFVREVRGEAGDVKKGDVLGVDSLEGVGEIKITGVSKGRGFTGVIKRYNFSRGPETHGSHHHREPGSVGMCAKPGRILKGQKMPGRHGGQQKTFITKVVSVDKEKNLVAVRGGVPGAKDSYILIQGR